MRPLAHLAADWPALDALLDEALTIAPEAQEDWLDGLGPEHAAHRAVLRDLLGRRDAVESRAFLNAMPHLSPAVESAGATLAPGLAVGPYRLIAAIGEGGMGSVWLAERTDRLVERPFALKLPRAAWGTELADRLSRERRILGSLEHRHIARLYDAGVDEVGRPFLAMERVDGDPIDRYCRDKTLSIEQRLALVLQVAAAVSHAHAKLVVHRDLKPSNILVNREGEVKLLDFGIAKLLEGDRTQRTALTEYGGAALSVEYASPEQIRGLPLGTASDVYSLGVVTFELMTGVRPYVVRQAGRSATEDAILNFDPRLASESTGDPSVAKRLRGDLDAILNKALKKDPDERYRSIDAFAEDLRRHLVGLPVEAQPDSRHYRLGKFLRRHRFAVAMNSALAVSIVAGAGVSLWQAREARAQAARATAELDAQVAVRDLYQETVMTLSLTAAKNAPSLGSPHAIVTTLRQKLDEIAARFSDKPTSRDAQLEAVTLQLNYDGDFEGSLAVGRELLASLQSHGAPPARVILAYGYLGRTLFQLKRWDECEAARRAGAVWSPATLDEQTTMNRSVLVTDLASLLISQGRRDEAAKVLREGDAMLGRAALTESFTWLPLQRASLNLGFDDARALSYARRSHELASKSRSISPDQQETDLVMLGAALAANGLLVEAEAALRAAVTLDEDLFPANNRGAVRAFSRLVGAVSRQGQYQRAGSLIDEERHALEAAPGGITPFADIHLRARRLEIASLAGDALPPNDRIAPLSEATLSPSTVVDSEFLASTAAQVLAMSSRGAEAVALLDGVQRRWPTRDRLTLPWVRLEESLATAELSAGDAAAAQATSSQLRLLLEREHATTGDSYRTASELEALSAARLGNAAAAAAALARAKSLDEVAYPSAVEKADSFLRRAEVALAIGRSTEAADLGRLTLANLSAQHPQSPRLAEARRLAALAR